MRYFYEVLELRTDQQLAPDDDFRSRDSVLHRWLSPAWDLLKTDGVSRAYFSQNPLPPYLARRSSNDEVKQTMNHGWQFGCLLERAGRDGSCRLHCERSKRTTVRPRAQIFRLLRFYLRLVV